ncbi:KGG domain-containing protein [Paenibacillus lentus]|uniref:Stress-induced protein, KGG, repeat-containing protein n=1 Tax=Paenibacillus lentus TaxID=1338368 RepID=A0A3S8RTD0_9BACL|nr:KGG domain-containing protein [Paenibacillus lentus]AZK46375.1 stress-induced protein, KGG, repeat-containing protein [Paenibacillus lentus]
MANNNRDGKMSLEEAGRKGGEATASNHDKEFYQEIGQKGGEARRDSDKMSREEAGRKGGEARARQRKDK